VPHLVWGTVLDDGEEPAADRVRAAGGPGTVVALHGVYEYGGPVAEMPGGAAWLELIERVPESERHLVVHEGHCVGLNAADEAAWDAGAHGLLQAVTVSGTRDEVRQRVEALAEQGATEVVYQPAGPDIRRELETFIEAARG
jgi:alkanesulfonate monooxygenase SsuD/methylene tetrahydromethanopterin reductase-like flavin-dependent oxidoreductase (luciferase family)